MVYQRSYKEDEAAFSFQTARGLSKEIAKEKAVSFVC